jgi:CheY-like chemotaxis protein
LGAVSSSAAVYGIAAVERMTRVPAATILDWRDRFDQPWGATGPGGETLFSRDDIEAIIAFARKEEEGPDDALSRKMNEAAARRTKKRLLILLAERDDYAAELTEYFLRTEGYAVEAAFDVNEAIRRFEQVAPDLAIVELLIEGGEGFELCRRLQEKGSCPVVAISSLDPGKNPILGEVDAVLRKPLSPLALISTVRDLLGTSALLGERP